MSYRVRLNTFEGPFDLLVYLIEHAQMNIYDISISEITNQYIAYIEDMKRADLNLSSEFMVLAAALLEIKSKMLLPRSVPEGGEREIAEDPRTELVQKLVEYKRFKDISEMLEQRAEMAARSLQKPQEDLSEYTGEADEYLSLDLEKFKAAFEQFLRRKKKLEEIRAHHRRSEKQRITTEIRMENIREFFRGRPEQRADFRELIEKKDDKYDVAVTFSSVLEMMKARKLDAEQRYTFGDITVTAAEHLFDEDRSAETGDATESSILTEHSAEKLTGNGSGADRPDMTADSQHRQDTTEGGTKDGR